ncbi:MAG TPA: hypothetical protein VGK59_10585 [Ohtaekwangia sp.]
MKKITFIYALLLVSGIACKGQISTSLTLYNSEFNWTIVIPEDFNSVSAEEWSRLQNKGEDAVEKTYDAEVTNQVKTIFVFKSGDFNYLESNQQPYDVSVDGNYLETCKQIKEILFETFRTQMPNAKIDTLSAVETISGLEFQKFRVDIDMPNGMKFTSLLYSRLFGKKEFSVNMMYVEASKGQQMLDAWRNSKFE